MLNNSRLSKAPGTWRAYDPLIRRWAAFCARNHVPPLGASGKIAALFLTSLQQDAAARNIGPQLVERGSAAVSAFYEQAGLASPCADPLCAAAREAARRCLSSRKLDRDIVSPDDIKALVAHHLSGQPSLRTRMHVTCAVLGFSGLLRYSDITRVMVHHDLMRFYPDRVELFLFTSKTDQHCEGALVPIGRIGGPCCPVQLLEDLLRIGGYKCRPAQAEVCATDGSTSLADAEDVGPLLRAVSRNGQHLEQVALPLSGGKLIKPLAYSTFRTSLVQLFAAAGVTKQLGTHSLRKGGATAAVQNGADRMVVRKLGRWRSEKVFEFTYVREGSTQQRQVTVCLGLTQPDM